MASLIFSNNATTTLAGAINNVATSISLAPGSGVLFPAPTAGQSFKATLTDAATGLINEIVKVTNVTGDVATVVRGQEGTTAVAWNAGDNFSNLWTAGTAQGLAQVSTYAGEPNGSVTSGQVDELVWDTTHGIMWSAATAGVNNAWVPVMPNPIINGPSVAVPNTSTYTTLFGNILNGAFLVNATDVGGTPQFMDFVVFTQFVTLGVLGTTGGGARAYRSKPSTGELQLSLSGASGTLNCITYSLAPQQRLYS